VSTSLFIVRDAAIFEGLSSDDVKLVVSRASVRAAPKGGASLPSRRTRERIVSSLNLAASDLTRSLPMVASCWSGSSDPVSCVATERQLQARTMARRRSATPPSELMHGQPRYSWHC